MPETTVLKVLLHCDGCVSKVKRHIRRLQGVQSLHIDQENSKVTVYGTVKPQDVLEKVLRAGKTAEFWPVLSEPAEEVVAGGKKKAAGERGDGNSGSAKKQKQDSSTTKLTVDLEYDDGDGEIVDIPPEVGVEGSDTKGLMDKTPATPSKKARGQKLRLNA